MNSWIAYFLEIYVKNNVHVFITICNVFAQTALCNFRFYKYMLHVYVVEMYVKPSFPSIWTIGLVFCRKITPLYLKETLFNMDCILYSNTSIYISQKNMILLSLFSWIVTMDVHVAGPFYCTLEWETNIYRCPIAASNSIHGAVWVGVGRTWLNVCINFLPTFLPSLCWPPS